MHRGIIFACIGATLSSCFLSVAPGAETSELFSPSTADAFYEKAVDIYTDPNATAAGAKQAMVFFMAVGSLDRENEYAFPDMVRLAWRFPTVDFQDSVKEVLAKYATRDDADLEVLRLGVQYLLNGLNSREGREDFFRTMLRNLGTRHKILNSDIATQLALLAAERSDMQTAESFLLGAYSYNRYNQLAFQKLTEVTSRSVPPAVYIGHLRLMMGANPYNIDYAFAFANSTYNVGLYSIAASAYGYCADLFAALHPDEKLPPVIYLPWAMSSYNEQHNLQQCLSIAGSVRESGRFDLYLEAIAANAAIKLGNAQQGAQMLDAAAKKAAALIPGGRIRAQDIAWFYCFAQPDAEKALAWANQANASEPNSPRVGPLLAYALVMNGQQEIAKHVIEQYYKSDQIAGLAMGQIQLAQDANAGLETLKAAIALDAGSLEAQRGKELLSQKGSTYVYPYETTAIVKMLQGDFGENIVNKFVTPDKLIATKLAATGSEFSYGSHFNANLTITNKGVEPINIFDDGFFKGNIRVDAAVKGDLNQRIPNLIVQKIRPPDPIESGQSMFVPLKLNRGRLKSLLLEHPQASVEIEFTVYLDPGTDPNGAVHSGIWKLEPAHISIRRNGVDLSGAYLQNRLSSLSKGQPGQKAVSAQLFTGLLLEQRATKGSHTYRMRQMDSQLLRAALARCINDKSWTLRVETMLMLENMPLDYNLTSAVGANLNDDNWPVQMTALWLLGKNGDPAFKKVLDWTAKNGNDKFVLDMASALGATPPPPELAVNESSPEANEPLKLAAKEPNLPSRSSVASTSKTAETPPASGQIVFAEPNRPIRAVLAEPNQPAKAASAEPNQPQKAASAEPNQPPKAAPEEPNSPDILEQLLKS
jgi:hypothetical protein